MFVHIYVCMSAAMYVSIKSFSSVYQLHYVSAHPVLFPSLPFSPLPSLPLLPGLLGVSPSPFNCSSVDNNTNTCTVPATINSSLTLCVDFVEHPEHAKRYAELDQTIWQVLPGEENVLSCYNRECTSSRKGYSLTGDWGRCLHVESVERDTLFNFSIAEVFPPKDYPPSSAGIVHRTMFFDVQG